MAEESTGFLARLKQHHIYRVAAWYGATVAVLIQVVARAFPYFGWSVAVPAVIIILIAGFPVAIVLAWLLVKTGDSASQSVWQKRHWKLGAVVVPVVIAAVVVSGYFALGFSERRAQRLANASAAVSAVPAKSIAVLPFENLSGDKDNAYFANGMQDLILTKLVLIGDLKVISRTSTEKYASHPDNLKSIAQQLGVATILEGSVQKAGNQVLIDVQLIDARSDTHLWAQAYPRTLDNIFGVEGEVAQSIADALKAKLSPDDSARVAAIPTQNPQAYDLYLRALAHFNLADDQYALTRTEMPPAIELLQQALQKDPDFALADALLGQAQMYRYFFGGDRSDARLQASKDATDRALHLQPDLGQAHLARALYWYWGFRDYARAQGELALARKTLPHDAQVESYEAAIARRQGRWQQALDGFGQALAYDPRNSQSEFEIAQTYAVQRRYAEADRGYAHATELSLDPTLSIGRQAWNTVIWRGDLVPLRTWLAGLPPGSSERLNSNQYYFNLGWLGRDFAAAAQAARESKSTEWNATNGNTVLPRRLYLAWALAAAGDRAGAAALYRALHTEAEAAARERPGDWDRHLALGFTAAGLGMKDEALREGRKAAELLPIDRDAFAGPEVLSYIARIDVRVGANDQAIALLQKLSAIPAGLWVSPALLQLDPVWDPLRKDPRFQALLQ
ncbi:MAG: hypothetical protein KGL98_04590 [Gammaproteobacteria bacterium]|nr:hypothetical protein [Gammaproteobacteria bacterium]